MTYEEIVSKLSGTSLKEYSEAILYLKEGQRDGTLNIQLDQEIMERVAAVYIFEKWSDWTELGDLLNTAMDVLPHHAYMFEKGEHDDAIDDLLGDMANMLHGDRNLLGGLAIFCEKLSQREIDTSAFHWLYRAGSEIEYVAMECDKFAEKIKEKNADHAAKMTACGDILRMIATTQTDTYYFINRIESGWTEEMAQGVYNILIQCGSDGESRLLQGLSFANADPVVYKMMRGKYMDRCKEIKSMAKKNGNEQLQHYIDETIAYVNKEFAK